MNQIDYRILSRLRKNSRASVTQISRDIDAPVSTVFDRIKKLEDDYVIKHTSLLNHPCIRYHMRVSMVLRADKKSELRQFLMNRKEVNSLYLIERGDLMCECIFRDMKELSEFSEKLDDFDLLDKKEIHVVEDLKNEEFLTEEEHFQF